MEKLENMTNNEILMEIKKMQADHEVIKLRMLKDNDVLDAIEKRFAIANAELLRRLKGDK
jgi:RNA-binding protein YhbY